MFPACTAQEWLPQLVCASLVSIIGAALEAHVRQACEQGWGLPQQLPRTLHHEPRPPMQVRHGDIRQEHSARSHYLVW